MRCSFLPVKDFYIIFAYNIYSKSVSHTVGWLTMNAVCVMY